MPNVLPSVPVADQTGAPSATRAGSQISTANPPPPPAFPRAAGETPRAYSAFFIYFQLGHSRSLRAAAERLGEHLSTVKNWSSKFAWSQRVQDFNAGLLQQHAQIHADTHRRQTADWAGRLESLREQEWHSAQKLACAADSFLESFGEEDLRRLTLDQAARALSIASAMARAALIGTALPEAAEPGNSPLQQQLLTALQRIYAAPDAEVANPTPLASSGSERPIERSLNF